MPGMIGTGLGYQRNAMSGFARLSAQEQQRQQANKNLDAQSTQQEIQMGMQLGGLAAMALFALL